MPKVKILVGLAAMICALAITAVPASAWFEGKGGKNPGQGKGKALVESKLEGGGGKLTCPAVGTSGAWEIETPTSTTEPKVFAQKKVNPGPDLVLQIKWPAKGCKAEAIGFKEEAKVTQSIFHLQQKAKGATTATGTQIQPTIITTGLCEVTAVMGKEIQPRENFELKANTLTNNGSQLKIRAADVGVTTTVKGFFCPITGGSENKFEAEAESEKDQQGQLAEGLNEI